MIPQKRIFSSDLKASCSKKTISPAGSCFSHRLVISSVSSMSKLRLCRLYLELRFTLPPPQAPPMKLALLIARALLVAHDARVEATHGAHGDSRRCCLWSSRPAHRLWSLSCADAARGAHALLVTRGAHPASMKPRSSSPR
jgi:hypothetical protein